MTTTLATGYAYDPTPGRRARVAGWTLLGLFAAFMLGASVLPKFAMTAMVAERMAGLGWPDAPIRFIGALEAVLTLLVLWPRTAQLGAVLMTGLLGGAIATNLQAGTPLFTHTLFGIYLGALMWAGLWLRDPALRALLPFGRR
jgi:hypothetical protein